MHIPISARAACALVLLLATNAWSADSIQEIRKEIRELRESYEARIRALEERLKDAESKAQQATAPAPAPPPTGTSTSSGLAAFNPASSVVLQGRYANLSQDPRKFAIAGFPMGGEIGPGKRGFSLAESELALFANVDHLFSGTFIAALSPDDTVSVEEAYGIYMGALFGIVPKFGRFFSGIGYQNEQHQHAWEFIDPPLAYQAFLGGQYTNDGVQFKWVAPIDHYVELGAEAGGGSGFPGSDRNKNGAANAAAYAHTGGDVGVSNSWRAGVSYLRTRPTDRSQAQLDAAGNLVQSVFSGTSRVAIGDFVWKWAPNGNSRETNFKIQGEYFQRREEGALNTAAYSARQSGWYVQGVYQFIPAWRVGARYDRLDAGSVASFNPERYSAMLDWSPSEFSRVRLQFSQSKTRPDLTDNQVFVQYILSLGAHGAHKY